MDNKMPYQKAGNTLNEMNRENHYMDETLHMAPPPAYNGAGAGEPVAQQPTVVKINSTTMPPPVMPILPQPVGPKSTDMTCPHCRCRVKTRLDHRSTAKTHIACLLLSWTLCCCCLPYCMDSCRNTNHFCPMCGAYLGTYAS